MKLLNCLILFFISALSVAQVEINIWEDETKPFYKENSLKEYEAEAFNTRCVFKVTKPTLTIYKPQGENSGKAVLIIPGGGYGLVAMYHEGYDIANRLAENGITAAVLKYRLPDTLSSDQPHKVPLADARQALKLLRFKSDDYAFDDQKVGVLGFSAGSHLATVMGLWESNNETEVPDFSVLIYGVSRLDSVNLQWLEESLYYRKLTEDEIMQNTLLDLVNENTPPAFLVHAYDDNICQIEESTLYAEKLLENNVPVEMHLFQKGGHGFGAGREKDGTNQWLNLFISWLKRL